MDLSYFILFLSLVFIAFVYYRVGLKFQIVDKPNHRSSHTQVTVRGGGILFPIAVLIWWFAFGFQNSWMVLGLVGVSLVSLLDDIYSLSRKIRFTVQFVGLSLAFYDLGVFEQIHWIGLPLLYFIALGIINAINFMDGINGISGLYGITFFGTLLVVNAYFPIFDEGLIYYLILAISVFLLFNLRKRALMFAGDIGSISLAYMMIYFLVQWYLAQGNWSIVLMLLVYGADVFLTVAERIKNSEKITEPHRSHLYQFLANQGGKSHVVIAICYSLLQFVLNYFFFIKDESSPDSIFAFLFIIGFGLVYLAVKLLVRKTYVIE